MSRTDKDQPSRLSPLIAWDWWKHVRRHRHHDEMYNATDPRYFNRARRERYAMRDQETR